MAIERIDGSGRDWYRYQKHDATMMVGGTSRRFQPLIIGGKWSDECWFSFVFPINNTSRNCTFTNGVVQIVLGDYSFKFYEDLNGDLEYEIILGKRPAKSSFEIDIDFPTGLDFCYQPALTQEEIDEGFIRPANVVNSYALYWNKANNQYKTGKLCHIFRPLLTDALGKWTWGNLTINPTTKKLTIAADSVWLRDATYPVIIDPTLGYSSAGASNHGENTRVYCTPGTTDGTGGNVSMYHCAVAAVGADDDIKLGIYTDSSGVPLSLLEQVIVSASVSNDNQQASSTTPSLSASTSYWVAVIPASNDTRIKYDYGSAENYREPEGPISYADELASTVLSGSASTAKMSIWVTYGATATASLLLRSPRKNIMRSLLAR